MTLKERILNIILRIFYYSKFRFIVHYGDIDRLRLDPFILIGNHASLHDGLYTAIHFRKYPFPVINVFMYSSRFTEFVLTKIIHSVPKRKGQSDISTIRSMMDIIRKKNRGVMLFPEGNSSYFGKESDFPYSTVKFLKKMKLDIVLCMVHGAFLSSPRWGKSVKKGTIQLDFKTVFKAEALEDLSLDEIYNTLKQEMKFNDFDWNREHQYRYSQKHRAEGLEQYLYICPKCNHHQTLSTKGHRIFCSHCGEIAHFDEYSFLVGLPFDNLVDWDLYQKQFVSQLSKEKLITSGIMSQADTTKHRRLKYGAVSIQLDQLQLSVTNSTFQRVFAVEKIKGLVLTTKNALSFDYEQDTYYINFKDPMLFLDVIDYIKGGN